MAFPLLPPLKKDDERLAVLPKTGTWEQVPPVALNNIADNLQVTKVDAKYIDIDSIPSMWARPLLFEIALYDEDHPMHECIVDEWRGLLAMLALKELRKFRLETQLITIPDGDGGKTPEFLEALRKLMPERTLDDAETTWEKLYLILFEGKPIGMTSPTTLVFTSIDYINYITVNDVPWYAPPFLCDPIPHLNDGEKTSVAGWLNDFHKNTITPLPDSPIKVNLAPRILDFIKDLGGAPDGPPKLANTPLGMDVGIFTGMNFPIAPKEYFTEKLFVIPRSDAFLKQNILLPTGSDTLKIGGDSVTPILPIAKELLNDFSVDQLSKRITFKTTPVGFEVDLKLPAPGGGPDFAISRVYVNQKDGDASIFDKHKIVEIPNLPVLEIWPNFRMPGWKVYYTYFNKAQQDTFYVEPFPTGGSPEDMKITKTSAFPEAMICKYESEDAGFLFIKAPMQTVPDATKTWNVGIDFGTSSTTVYKTELPDGAGPESVTLRGRLLQITDSQALRTAVQNDFLSDRDEETPLFSLFQENSIGIPPDDRIKPLLDGRIYFVDDPKLPENVISNLKWSPEPIDRKRTQAYLEQICLQCAAEAAANSVSKINWRFSYPIAFSPASKDDFEGICQAVIDDIIIKETGGQPTGLVSLESESIVTAKFFAGEFGGFADGSVCIDIGGETSDISIWQKGALCWQTSIRFAGRHIFLDLLKHKPNFLRDVGVTEAGIPALRNPNDFYSQADTLIGASINNSPKDLKAKFGIYGGKIKSTPFVPLIGLGISGLFYYVGLILNYLSRETEFRKTMPNIYIGGNGSRILHWLANGEFKPDSDSCGHLKNTLLTASGFAPESLFDLEITPNPKHEAAAGLVDAQVILESTERQFDFLAGEVFTENGKDHEWTELLTAERLGKSLRSGDKLMETETFIEEFNDGLGKSLDGRINLDRELKKKLTSDLNDKLENLAKKPDKERVVEPLFILVLKKLLGLETAEWK